MIRDAFNIKVEEIARYFGYSRMLVNDRCIFDNSTMFHLNNDFVITTFYLMFVSEKFPNDEFPLSIFVLFMGDVVLFVVCML